MYKIPKIPDCKNHLVREGVAYLYMDSENYRNGWVLSENDICSKNSIPGNTLTPFYDNVRKKFLNFLKKKENACV